jgi:hypothetical protein
MAQEVFRYKIISEAINERILKTPKLNFTTFHLVRIFSTFVILSLNDESEWALKE